MQMLRHMSEDRGSPVDDVDTRTRGHEDTPVDDVDTRTRGHEDTPVDDVEEAVVDEPLGFEEGAADDGGHGSEL